MEFIVPFFAFAKVPASGSRWFVSVPQPVALMENPNSDKPCGIATPRNPWRLYGGINGRLAALDPALSGLEKFSGSISAGLRPELMISPFRAFKFNVFNLQRAMSCVQITYALSGFWIQCLQFVGCVLRADDALQGIVERSQKMWCVGNDTIFPSVPTETQKSASCTERF